MLIMFRIESTVSPELDHGLVHKDGELGHRRESSTQSTHTRNREEDRDVFRGEGCLSGVDLIF